MNQPCQPVSGEARQRIKSILLFVVLAVSALVTFSQTTSWTGTTSSSWSNSANWTNGVPTATVDALIGNSSFTGTFQPALNTVSYCKSLTIGGTIAATLTQNFTLVVANDLTINANGTLSSGSTISLADDWTNSGTYITTSTLSSIVFAGYTQSIGGNNVTTFRVLTINPGSTVTLNRNMTVAGTGSKTTIQGTFDPNQAPGYIATLSTVVADSGSTIRINTSTYTGNYNLLGPVTVNPGVTVEYSSTTIDQTITNLLPYSTLKISGTTVKSIPSNLNFLANNANSGNIILAGGTLNLGPYTANRPAGVTGGTLSISNGATLRIRGVNSFPTGFATVKLEQSSTVEYAGTTQAIAARAYGNLAVSDTGTKTAQGVLTLGGNFSLDSATFVGGNFTHSIAGNWSMNSGVYTNTSNTILFNGSGAQSIKSSGAFRAVTINKPAGSATLLSDVTITSLVFTKGLINTGTNEVIIPSGGTITGAGATTGWINGRLQEYFSAVGGGTFEIGGPLHYTPLSITFTSVTTAGSLIAGVIGSGHPNISTSTIKAKNISRYWTLSKPATGAIVYPSSTITFNWNTADNYTPLTTSKLVTAKYTSSAWSLPTVTGTSTANTMKVTSVSTLGDFAVGETNSCTNSSGFKYAATEYCSNGGSINAILNTGATAGTFTASPAGLSLNSATGAINLNASTAGSYTVKNTNGSGSCVSVSTVTININQAPSASISYGSPLCKTGGLANVTRTGTAGGVFSSTRGLDIDGATGQIDLADCVAGTYVVTYTVTGSTGCAFATTTSVTITTAPSASISYPGSPFCINGGSAAVSQYGEPGGIYSSTTGLSINAATGAINLNSTTAGTYTVTYTIAAANGCAVLKVTAPVTIVNMPTATIDYTAGSYNQNSPAVLPATTGTTGGIFSSTKGLDLDEVTGSIVPAQSAIGTYTVTYTVSPAGGCTASSTDVVTITAALKTWDGGAGTNNWGDAANWNNDGVPASTDNVTLTGANTININVAAVAKTLTINNPGLTLTINAGNSLTLAGDLVLTTGTLNTANAFPTVNGTTNVAGGTVGFTGSVSQIIPAENYNNLTSSSTGSRTLAGAGTIRIAGTFTPGTNTYVTTGSTVDYNAAGAQAVAAITYNNLTISNSGTKTAAGNVSVNGALTINASTVLDMSTYVLGGTVLTVTGTGTLKTRCTAIPAIPVGATWLGTVEYNNPTGSQRIVAGTYTNLTNSNTSGTNNGNGVITVSGILTLNNLSVLNMGTSALSGNPTSIVGTGSLLTQNTSTAPIPLNKTWPGSITYNNATGGQTVVAGVYTNFYNQNASGVNNAGGNITVNALFDLNTSSAFDLGDYLLNGTLSVISGSGILRTQSISATPIPSGKTWSGIVEYDRLTGGQTIVAGTYTNLTNSNTTGINTTAGEISVETTLTLNASSILNLGINLLSGNFTTVTGSGTLRTQNTSASPVPSDKTWSGTVEYNIATGGQTVVAGTYNNLKLGNTSGTHSVSGNVTAGGTLTFSGGTITTGVYTVYSTGTVTRTSGHVVGNFQKNIPIGTSSKIFEIGDATNYTPVTLNFASVTTAGDLTATTSVGDHDSIGNSQINVTKTVNRTWNLTNSGIAFTTYDATFTFVPTDVDAGQNTSTLVAANYSNNTWTYPTSGLRTATSTQAIGLINFNEFQIGFFTRYHYKSQASGNWDNMSTWDFSADGGKSWAKSSKGPTLNSDSVLILVGHTVKGTKDMIPALLTINGIFNPEDDVTMTGGILNGSGTLNVTKKDAPADFNSQFGTINRDVTNLTVIYNVSGAQTVNNLPYKNLVLSGSGVKTLPNSAMTVIGDFTTSGSISTTAATDLTIGGNVNLGSGTGLNLGSTTHHIAGNWTNNGATVTTGTSTVDFNGTLAQNLGGSAASSSFYNLTVSNTLNAVKVNTNTNISGILNMNGATTLLTPAATVVINSAAAAGTVTGSGTIQVTRLAATANYASQYRFLTNTLTNLTVDYAGAGSQTVNLSTYGGLKASGTGTKTVSGNIVVNGVLTIDPNVTLNMGANTLSGTLTSTSGNGTLNTQNTSATPLPLSKTWSFAVNYNSASAQNIVAGNYANLSAAGGKRTLSSVGLTGIAGTFTPGTGTYTITGSAIDFNGSSAQSVPAFTYNRLNVSGGDTKSVTGSVIIRDALTVSENTTLALGAQNITLKSDSAATARVGVIAATGAITYGTGRFIVERYIPGRRRYRLITSPVTSSVDATLTAGQEALSIWGNWQNAGVNTTPNVGTVITGGKVVDGFDTQTLNSSLFTYNPLSRKFVAFNSAAGNKTKYTPLKAGVAYYMFVYGDRQNSITTSTPRPTVLSSKGTLLTGQQVFNTTSEVPLASTAGEFSLLGNPYACTIDWKTVQKAGVATTIWGWDAGLSSTGGYVTVTASQAGVIVAPASSLVSMSRYVQPGQGFFVHTTAANPQVIINEKDKIDDKNNINSNVFRGADADVQPLLAVNMLYTSAGQPVLADGVVAAFDAGFSNDVNDEDGLKMLPANESISIAKAAKLLSIETRTMPGNNDTIFLNMGKITKAKYTLEIFANNMGSGDLQAYLEDAYLKTSKQISLTDTNRIVFDVVSSIAASKDVNRFRIVFKQQNILPVTFTTIKAAAKNNDNLVEWNVATEDGIKKYEVERSSNGTSFQKVGEVKSRGNSIVAAYSWLDVNVTGASNYYRIRAVEADGQSFFSKVVVVKSGVQNAQVKVFPNPVHNQAINLQFTSAEKGMYTVVLHNQNGQTVLTHTVNHSGGSSNQSVPIKAKLPAGLYYLRVLGKKDDFNQRIIVE